MNQTYATEIARERFYEQMERYRNLNDSLDLPAAVIPLYLATVLFFLDRLVEFWPATWSWNTRIVVYIIFLLVVVSLTVFLLIATWKYCRTIWCYQDATDLSSPRDMDNWLRAVESTLRAGEELASLCEPGLRDDYVTAGDATFQQNESRSRRMFYCRRGLITCLVLTTISMLCYYAENRLVNSELKSNAARTAQKQA